MRATLRWPPARIAGALVLLAASTSLGVAADREPREPPKFKAEGDQIVITAGQVSLSDLLIFLSNATSLPVVVGEPSLAVYKEKVLIPEEIRIERKKEDPEAPHSLRIKGLRPVFSLLRAKGFDVQRVVLSSGREILEAVRVPLVNGKPVEPNVFAGSPHAPEPAKGAPVKKEIFISEGFVPLGAFLDFLSDFTGEEVVYQGAPGYEIKFPPDPIYEDDRVKSAKDSEPTIVCLSDMEANEEVILAMLEGTGFRVRRVIGEGDKHQIHVSPRPARPRASGLIRKRAADPKAK